MTYNLNHTVQKGCKALQKAGVQSRAFERSIEASFKRPTASEEVSRSPIERRVQKLPQVSHFIGLAAYI